MTMTRLGIYEKALPDDLSWLDRLYLVKRLGFDFIEMSIDESEERLVRLQWSEKEMNRIRQAMEVTGVQIHSICLSGHRRFPFGSSNEKTRTEAFTMMKRAIQLAYHLGVRIIQVAGYDVYYEEKSIDSREKFIRGLTASVKEAAQYGIILSIEVMDDPFMNSISKYLELKKQIRSPYLQVYPDLGNLAAWHKSDAALELEKGIEYITSVHLKDTLAVTPTSAGKFREVPFGEGCVDFLGLLKTLKRIGFEGPFLIEMWCGAQQDFEQQIIQAKKYLLPILNKAGYIRENNFK